MGRVKRRKNSKKIKRNFFIILLIILLIIISVFLIKTFFNNNKAAKTIKINNKVTIQKTVKKDPLIETIKQSNDEVLLTSVGDCTLGTDTNFDSSTSLPTMFINQNKDYNYFLKNVYSIFSKDDITTANLETTFTDATIRAEKTFVFKGSSDYVNILKAGSIEGVNIANNHIYDYLQKGFQDTVSTLQSSNMGFFGENYIWIKEVKGVKFGFLGYKWYDTNIKARVKADIEDLKKQNCIVIVNFHWGVERTYSPIDDQINLAHYAIENGADLIIGHHPHVIQSMEKYKNKIICYSLGNFCFGGNSNPSDKNCFILQCNFKFINKTLTSYGIKVIPCSISSVSYKNDYCPTPLTGDKKTALLNKVKKLSPNLNLELTDDFTYINFQ